MFRKAIITSFIKIRRNRVSYAMGIFLLVAMTFFMLSAGGLTVYASEEDGTASGAVSVDKDLDFFSDNPDGSGELDANGYHWDAESRKLSLKNVSIQGSVSLPDDTVEIEAEGIVSFKIWNVATATRRIRIWYSRGRAS